MIYRFGDCELDTAPVELRREGAVQPVEPQVFRLLILLIENREQVASKDQLIDAVWDGRIVSGATLSSRINVARRAVGDSGKAQTIVKTVARRGFGFVAPLRADGASAQTDRRARQFSQDIRYCTTADGVQLAYSFRRRGAAVAQDRKLAQPSGAAPGGGMAARRRRDPRFSHRVAGERGRPKRSGFAKSTLLAIALRPSLDRR